MKYAFIEAHREEFLVRPMCRVLGVSHSGYYDWRTRPSSRRQQRREALCEAIQEVFRRFKAIYGSPRVWAELCERGVKCCRNTVAKLMKAMALRSRVKRRFKPMTTDSRHTHEVAGNHLARQFERSTPNEAWAADITYIPTEEGWLYLAAIQELHSRRIVGWSMADHLRAELATQALEMAIATRHDKPLAGLLHHSDRGVQYASDAYQRLLANHGIVCSMSRKGDCWDNATIESFFATLKTELVNHETYATRSEARGSIFQYIEGFYNRTRKHSTLGYVSPVEFENMVL
ncbi:MAG: IS3 family transposase [Phycisphaeraceae bacterium]|nr:IS3 family transposase [Phycisphaeraceae bacterium]